MTETIGLTFNLSIVDAVVNVILDGEVIYHSGAVQSEEGDHAGGHETYVDIPNVFADGELLITLNSSQPNTAALFEQARVETRDMVLIGVVGLFYRHRYAEYFL